jgi:MerR HTH family regulatory protein
MTDRSLRSQCTGGGLGGESAVSEQIVQQSEPFRETLAGRVYMTGDLRALTGLPRTHMDFYLREGIIRPTARTGSGYLLFDDTELETLRAVLRWREEGVGIREIRGRLGRPAPQ